MSITLATPKPACIVDERPPLYHSERSNRAFAASAAMNGNPQTGRDYFTFLENR